MRPGAVNSSSVSGLAAVVAAGNKMVRPVKVAAPLAVAADSM